MFANVALNRNMDDYMIFTILTFLPETQERVNAHQDPTGCKWLFLLPLCPNCSLSIKKYFLILFSSKMIYVFFISNVTLQDVMNKLRSDTIMDMNLEKSRSKELVSV